jgi:hypothetical protein
LLERRVPFKERASFEEMRQMFESAHVGLQKQKDDLAAKAAHLTEANVKLSNELTLTQSRLVSLQVRHRHLRNYMYSLNNCKNFMTQCRVLLNITSVESVVSGEYLASLKSSCIFLSTRD